MDRLSTATACLPPPPGGGEAPGTRSIDATRFLRGVQVTNRQGIVEFDTVYPGWYPGRAIHIHMKAHVSGDARSGIAAGGHVAHTGQLFFPEEMTAKVARLAPYAGHRNVVRTTLEQDHVFRSQHGSSSVLTLEEAARGSRPSSLLATAVVAVDPQLTPRSIGGDRPGPPGPLARRPSG